MKNLLRFVTSIFFAVLVTVMAISCDSGVNITPIDYSELGQETLVTEEIKNVYVYYQSNPADTSVWTCDNTVYEVNIPSGSNLSVVDSAVKAVCSTVNSAGWEAKEIELKKGSNGIWNVYFYRRQFTVNFFDEADVLVKTVTGLFGSSYTTPAPLTKEGFTFRYWIDRNLIIDNVASSKYVNASLNTTIPSGNRNYKAEFLTVGYYSVSYETEIGTAPSPIELASGTKLTASMLPVIENKVNDKVFAGWYIKGTNTKVEANYVLNSNIILVARWNSFYTVTYFDPTYNCETPAAFKVAAGSKLTTAQLALLTDSTTGFKSTYWSYNEVGGKKANANDTINSNIRLYANWNARYTISYVTKHGSTPSSKIVEANYKLTANDLKTITDKNTNFTNKGWYYDNSFDKKAAVNNVVNKDITLYAKWLNRYQVQYDSGIYKAKVPATIIVEEGYELTSDDLPTVTDLESGFNSIGWMDRNGNPVPVGYGVYNDVKLTAEWNSRYQISYRDSQNKITLPGKTVEKGYILTEEDLPTVELEKYISIWYIDNGITTSRITKESNFVVNSNVTLNCVWLELYEITYETKYGRTPSRIIIPQGDKLTALNLEKIIDPNYGFESLYWYNKEDTSKTPVTVTTNITSDMTLVAMWKERFTVSYITENGTAPASIIVEDGTKLTKENLPRVELPSNPPYFVGWFIGSNKVSSGYEVLSDVTLKAGWIDTGLPITYSSEYGTTPTDITVIPETVLGYDELPILEEPGHFFVGWFDADGNYYDPENNSGLTEPVELTAKWAVSGYRYVLNSNSSMSGTITSLSYPNYTIKLESTHGNISSISASYKKENIAKYEYLISSTTGEGSSSWSSNITLYNNSSERCTVVVSAVPQLLNEGGVPYDITDTTKATSLSGFMMMRTDSSNFTRAMYAFNVVAGTKYRVQWVDSFSYDNDSSWDFYASMPAGLCDQYIYIHSEDGSISKSSDDPTYLEFTATTDTVIYVISAGRGNTGLTYIQPYVIE